MSMTKKDYELLAAVFNNRWTAHKAALNEIGITVSDEDAYNQEKAVGDTIEVLVVEMAEALAKQNPRFDKTKFMDACEPAE